MGLHIGETPLVDRFPAPSTRGQFDLIGEINQSLDFCAKKKMITNEVKGERERSKRRDKVIIYALVFFHTCDFYEAISMEL